ncbi:hypothetical protein [Mycobacterium marinum]|uniref:hypothetical protein n=1 Tax=Mycobacterium marinum TaxID=1781 RepID=UPI003566F434
MTDEDGAPRVASYPGRLDAIGDGDQMVVIRSIDLQEADPIMLPVSEHIERHRMTLADEITVDGDSWSSDNKVVLSWYLAPGVKTPQPGELGRLWGSRSEGALPDPRTPVSINDGARLYATGDGTHLVVNRTPLSEDSDRSWRQALEHICRWGLVLAFEDTAPATARVPLGVKTAVYTTPADRFWVNDNPESMREFIRVRDTMTGM